MRPWVASVLLSVSAVFGGSFLITPICYWEGRILSQGEKLIPLAYQPSAEPAFWVIFALGVGWVALWSRFVIKQRRRPMKWLLAGAPLAVLALSALVASTGSYACNPF